METRFKTGSRDIWEAETLILFLPSGNGEGRYEGLEASLAKPLAWLKDSGVLADFPAKPGTTLLAHDPAGTDRSLVPRVILAGLGNPEEASWEQFCETWRNATAQAMSLARKYSLESVGFDMAGLQGLPVDPETLLKEFVFAAHSGLYGYTRLKSVQEPEAAFPERLVLFGTEAPSDERAAALAEGLAEYAGTSLARDLVNGPSNLVTPEFMAHTAQELAEEYDFGIKVLTPSELSEMGMGAFEAVFRGSANPARLVVLDSDPDKAIPGAPLLLVGKGVTFDTGGISIKPAGKMHQMKGDMGGAAAVLGFFRSLGEMTALRRSRRVVAVIPLTDNMPDGNATKPGDVVTTLSGKTVEIINTDAEGRLILCDALTYGLKEEPAMVVDLATLTGACLVALGPKMAGIFTNRDGLAEAVRDLGRETGEMAWPLPLAPHFFEELKSQVADLKNVGSRMGGASVAAMFLKQFVPDEVPWAHIDIAGPAFSDKNEGYIPKGGTGYGVRTLLAVARHLDEINPD